MLTSGTTSRFGLFGKVGLVGQLTLWSALAGAVLTLLALPAVGTVGIIVRNAATKFNNLSTPELGQLPVRSELLSSEGHVLAYYYPRGIDRVPVPFSQISPYMRSAIVAIEDSRFYQHGAIDIRGTVRALVNDLEHQPIQGGSTLTQQYVKNVEIMSSPNPQQAFASATQDTIGRKIREMRMAVRVEHSMSKDAILTAYLNVAYFGSNAYGVEVAAERYFNTTAAKLTLTQAATLAGIVENPSSYDPLINPTLSTERRNTVIGRMAQLHNITQAQAAAAEKQSLGLNPGSFQSGCTASSARWAGYLCDYVIAVIRHDKAYKSVWSQLNGEGGLTITTTLNTHDQRAANKAVDYMLPNPPSGVNPGRNADTEVIVQPGTGDVRAIAIDRPYGTGGRKNTLDYAVGPQYDGGVGMQIGSTGKVYTMVAALEQGIPFGYSKTVPFQADISGYTNCEGQPVGQQLPNGQLGWSLHNDEGEPGTHPYTLYLGTTLSINVFFAYLEQKVGLCNVVKAASQMGLTWPDGKSLLRPDRRENHQEGADSDPSFTLGADNVAPLDVAAADATLPARGIACKPVAITKIVNSSGKSLPVESADCHRALPQSVADAANYILQGDLKPLIGTASNDGIGRPAASKTGTADQYVSAFFVGYTPDLLGAVWVGNPKGNIDMTGTNSCYRTSCSGWMYGSMAPGQTWQMTFEHVLLANPPLNFVPVDPNSALFSMGNGQSVRQPPPPGHHGGGGCGGGHHHGGPPCRGGGPAGCCPGGGPGGNSGPGPGPGGGG